MYRIINANGGVEIGSTEAPRFIRKNSAGCYVQTDEKNAQGIAYKGTPYNLQGREGVDAEDSVLLFEFDAGGEAEMTAAAVAANSAAIDDILVSML